MDEIQQPVITPNPISPEKETTTPYVIEGLVVGIVLAIVIIGGILYKAQLSASVELKAKKELQLAEDKKQQLRMQQLQQIVQKTTEITPVPTAGPVVITTKEELKTQETVLQEMDLTDISKGLDETASDSSQFEL